MDIGKYKQAMRPKKYLDGKFVIYDETMPDASDAQLGARDEFAIGGGVIQGEDLGTREGFSKIELNPEFQKQVKNLLDQGFSNREVAEKLNRGVTTIKRVKDAIKYPSKKQEISDETNRRYKKLKELVEEANKGSKLVYQKDLAASVGIRSRDANFRKQYKKFNIPDLDTPADKAQKEFLKIIKNPETPIEDTFSLVRKISERTGVGASKVSEHLLKLPEYRDARKMLKTLAQVEFQKKIQDKGFTLGDFEEIIQQKKDAPKLQVSSISTPEKFIIDSAMRHQAAGGDKITFIKKPGDIDRQGNLITHKDAEFEFKGKRYSYFDLLKDGRKNLEFKNVYKVADDLNEFLGKEVIHPVTKEKVIFKNLMKEAYNKGAGYGYERAPYDIDHFKSVKEEPFKNLRVLPRRINTSQGIMMNLADTAQKGFLGEETASKYTPEKIKQYSKTMGYDYQKDINQLFKDELKLADDILVKGRVLKTPLDIAKESFVDKKTKTISSLTKIPDVTTANKIKRPESAMTREMFDRFNKLRGVLIPGLEEIKDSLKKLPDDIKSKRYFTAALKGLGIVATPLIVSGMYNDFKSGKTVMETLERNLIGTDAIGGMKDIFALSPEERQARSIVKQAEMDEQIAQDFSGLDTDFQTPRVESKMSLEEALKEYEEGLKRVELERQQEEAERAEGRASSFEGLKDLMLGERFQPQEIPQQFLASGGRVGFADGTPPDPSKRKFMKIMGALAAVPVIGKYFNLAKPLTKAAPAAVEAVKGIPPYFFKMVEKIKQYGDDVTKRFSTQEREQVYNYRTSDADYELYEDLNTGDTRIKVIKGDPDFPGYKEQELTLSKGKIDERTGNVPDAYDEYTVRSDFDGKMKDIDEGIEDIDDLIEDTIGFENVSIKELEDMGYDVNRLSPGFRKKLGIK